MAAIDLTRLNDSQRAVATRLDEPLFVAAGAGSGKTFTLTARLVHALSLGSATDGGRYLDSIDQALVITFTKAAALEIAERVRGALRAAGEEDPYLREESFKVDGAWISTIHGMCARILRRHAVELGVDPEFRVCEGSVHEALAARAMDEVLSQVQHDDAFAALRHEYALWSPGGIADMVRTLRSEASKCVDGFDGLVWPTTNETAACMRRLLAAMEAICAVKLTPKQSAVAEATRDAVAGFLALAPGEQTADRACQALAGLSVPSLRAAATKALAADARQCLVEAVVCAQYERVQQFAPQLADIARRVDERFAELKLERSYLDNDDLIALALEAVERCPEVTKDYAGRFRLVMIDEFQDTDSRQLRLIGLLSGEHREHLTTVGDAQQSIYRFRGGDVEVFREHGRSLPESAHVRMDVNYRSDPHVLAAVERVCGDTGMLGDFLKLAADGGRTSRYVARDREGTMPPRIRLEVANGGTSELMSAVLAAQLADRLADYHAKGQPQGSMALLLGTTSKVGMYLDALRARGLEALVTGGSSFSQTPEVGVMQALLHTLANPHDTQDGLFRLLSSEMFMLDADDFVQLGSQGQDKLDAPTKRPIEQCFVRGALELYQGACPSERLVCAHDVLRRAFSRMGRWPLADVCQSVVDESGWLERLEAQGTDGLARAANVLASVRYVRELTTDLGLGPARAADEFDRWLEASKLTPKNLSGDQVDAVRVMTVHGSKGLQFGVCAVAECWSSPGVEGGLSLGRRDGRCMVCAKPKETPKEFGRLRREYVPPEDWAQCRSVADWAMMLDAQEMQAAMDEKARLLYVALTRAEEALVVGLPVADKDWLRSPMAMQTLGAFVDVDELASGERRIEVSPQAPVEVELRVPDGAGGMRLVRQEAVVDDGVARVVSLARPQEKGDPWVADSAGSLSGFDGELPLSVRRISVHGVAGQDFVQTPDRSFPLYDIGASELVPSGWSPRDDVFSYSSVCRQLEERDASQSGKRPPAPTRAEQDARAEGSAYTPDADKATALGSAFHELAQTMVETKRDHSPERMEALARTWRLSERQRTRLRAAVERWERSELRQEAWSWPLVRAEVPFFVRVEDSAYGDYMEGAIDLLCTEGPECEGHALVVDYKTGDLGLGEEEMLERHGMQAELYAQTLLSQGFSGVSCAFMAVETGVVARWEFCGA